MDTLKLGDHGFPLDGLQVKEFILRAETLRVVIDGLKVNFGLYVNSLNATGS